MASVALPRCQCATLPVLQHVPSWPSVQETGNSEAAIGLAEQWISVHRNEHPPQHDGAMRDMSLIVAKAHCDCADRSLCRNNVEQAFESLQAAKGILADHGDASQLSGEILASHRCSYVLHEPGLAQTCQHRRCCTTEFSKPAPATPLSSINFVTSVTLALPEVKM
jgi:hypothetical protein